MIRFKRIGRKNQPSFKIVVTEKTKSSTGGRFVEEVGFYNPVTKEKIVRAERIRYWISQGAQPTPTISNLLISEKVTEGDKTPKHKTPKQSAAADATGQESKKPATGEGNQVSSGNLVSNPEPTLTPEQPKAQEPKPAEQPSQTAPEEGK